MVTIAFWNIAKRDQAVAHLPCLAESYSVDLFLLAECTSEQVGMATDLLNTVGRGVYRYENLAEAKIRAIGRLEQGRVAHIDTLGYLVVWTIQCFNRGLPEVILAGIHLPSPMGGSNDTDQALVAGDVIRDLYAVEDRQDHRNTVLVGDFNMNPYDPGMTSVLAVHGLMTAELASRPDRLHREKPYRRFYNPMWGLLGDRTPGAPGTLYWGSTSALHNTHWQTFDQLLLRPAIIGKFDGLQIPESDGVHPLISPTGIPEADYISDHLPVLFKLNV